ncbi:thioredoxin domain-containing protein 3 homolog isoform X3 [Mizuhopecten yessoensis]|uniref:thioredoxin domain-containing protein 3 homolog isoform X3 n=1 Tax=Mizuhopecten yessoensis TaxID=6573 RepID=UPI000B45E73E|nr:thioredoxin domain-containing protein 3 homolog isoform X3 [Mizuhopecten yessoensis]
MADQKKGSTMARRKQEIQLQQEIETQEEWEDIMSKEGLYVIDVYQEWCGPCSGLIANLKRLKNELGDDLLHFAIAKADTIDALEKYRGHCQPCFLFYAGGMLVAVIRGANSPMVMRTVTEQLQQEHRVIDGAAERKEIKDPYISMVDNMSNDADEDEEEAEDGRPASKKGGKQMRFKGELVNFGDENDRAEESKKEVTVAVIKPDAVKAGKVDEIIEDIKAHGIEILKQEERLMTEDEAKNIYTHLQDEDFFNDLITFMTSGPSHILVLTKGRTGENIINEFRDLIGPTSVEDAKEKQPESLRAKHGEKTFMNALHGSSSDDQAMRELAFFFPDFAIPASEGKPKLQRTLALIRPDAFKLHKDEVMQMINEAGFKVALQKEMSLTKEMAEDFYREHEGQEYFNELTTRMSSGPLMALGLAREDAVEGWRSMLGPKELDKAKEESPDSLRAKFALEDVAINQFHGSDSEAAAQKELDFFFPVQQTIAVIKPDALGTKDEIIEKVHDAGFKIAARKETTLSREIAEEFYSDHKDKDYYNDLVEHMSSGPTMFMVLSREDAVDGWRSLIGPTDPEKAKEESPDSLRALYGGDILKNAVHGSSNVDQAKTTIQKIFGDLKFTPEGLLITDEAEMQEQEEKSEEKTEEAGEEAQQKTEGEEQKEGEGEEKKEESAEGGDQTTEQQGEEQDEGRKSAEDKPSKEQTESKQTEEPSEQKEGDVESPKEEQAETKEQDTPVTKKSTEVEDAAPEDRHRLKEAEQAKTEEDKPKEEEKPTEEAKPTEEEKPKEEEKAPEEPPKTEEEAKPEEAKTEEETPKEEQKTEEAPKEEEKTEEAPKEEEKKEEEVKQEEETPKPTEEAKPEGGEETKTEEPEQKAEEPKTEEETKPEEAKPEEAKAEGEEEKKEETKTEGEGAA